MDEPHLLSILTLRPLGRKGEAKNSLMRIPTFSSHSGDVSSQELGEENRGLFYMNKYMYVILQSRKWLKYSQ